VSLLLTTAGSKLHIGAVKTYDGTDFIETDFTSGTPTWTEVGGTTNLGSVGDTATLVTSDRIGESRTRKAKGTRNAGTMEVICDLIPDDAGQIALIAAEKTKSTYAFRLQFPDAPAGGTPSTRYFTALIMSTSEQFDEANSAMKLVVSLDVDSNIVRIPAAEA
jgi:hypothetical protein